MSKKAAEDVFRKAGVLEYVCLSILNYWAVTSWRCDFSGLTPNDVQVVELHDCFSTNELLTYEALGLCPEGSHIRVPLFGRILWCGRVLIRERRWDGWSRWQHLRWKICGQPKWWTHFKGSPSRCDRNRAVCRAFLALARFGRQETGSQREGGTATQHWSGWCGCCHPLPPRLPSIRSVSSVLHEIKS